MIYLMDFCAMSGDGRVMRSTFSKLDRAELRQDCRRAIPIFEIIVECELFRSIDWSIGGVQLDGVCEGVRVGSAVDGWIALPEMRKAFAFSGRIVRTDPKTGNTVLRFDEVETEMAEFLDRAVAARLH
jgi:hypothetical protein